MPTNPDEREPLPNTYIMGKSRDEMTRVALQDQFTTHGMGGVLPEQSDPSLFERVLDVACGTGGWLIETAQTYPTSMQLIGVDANPRMVEYAQAQAQTAQVHDRVEFRAMNALLMLDFPSGSFDLVNMRFATSFIRTHEWPKILHEMQRVLRSGGVIRLTEFERFTSSHPAPLPPFALGGEAMLRAGHLFSQGETTDTFTHGTHGIADDLARLLSENGMSHIQTRRSTLSFLPGTPEAHRLAEDLRIGSRTAIPFLQKWDCLPNNPEQLCQEMVLAMQQPDYVASWSMLTAWGQR